MKKIDEVCKILIDYKSFALFTHINADGDAIGSILGLGMSLEIAGKKVKYVVPEPVPVKFNFLKNFQLINKDVEKLSNIEVGILLDAADTNRIDELRSHLEGFGVTVNIDHHVTNGHFATVNFVDGNAPSTTAIVLEILEHAHLPINADISNALFAGLLTDTGSFHYPNANRDAFLYGAKLLDYGADPAFIANKIFEMDTMPHQKLLGLALLRMEVTDRIAYSYIMRKDIEEFNASDEDTEGIIDVMRKIKDAEYIVLFKETRKREVRVSLRGKNSADVRIIAEQFGGGGHRAAAGCTIGEQMQDAINEVLSLIKEIRKE